MFYKNEKIYYVYIATNHPRNTVLYTGVTNHLAARSKEHKNKIHQKSFTARYNVNKVVFYETYGNINAAVYREKEIKGWVRKKKINLINKMNPEWKDLVRDMDKD